MKISLLVVFLCAQILVNTAIAAPAKDTVESLGQMLYFDPNLSLNRTQSCATCHSPERGFIDPRDNGVQGMASLGDDGKSIGDRNAPTAAYASFSPDFHLNAKGQYIGGQFYDGREKDLKGQAGGPPLNPAEMAMPNKQEVIKRLQENTKYQSLFKKLYGNSIFEDIDQAYLAMTQSIEAFEKTDLFSPFNSKYDRYLKGTYKLTTQEDLGMTLFFSQQFTNCNICHQLRKLPSARKETFSNYEYHNIGTPTNSILRVANGLGDKHIDQGLLENPLVQDKNQAGKIKVPTLRNISVTGPYMHNGVFKDLRTVILFYNKYNTRSAKRQINPETSKKWREPEVNKNISLKELKTGPALDNKRIDALLAFLNTLTDKRYEHLLTP